MLPFPKLEIFDTFLQQTVMILRKVFTYDNIS